MAAPKPLAGRQLRGMRARRNWHQRPCAVTGVELSMRAHTGQTWSVLPSEGARRWQMLLLGALVERS